MDTPGTSSSALRARLIDLLEPVVRNHGAVLVDLELKGPLNSQILRLLVHRDPGITIDLCEMISVEVADVLDGEDPILGRYRLEVTSPGLDRPLRTEQDYTRAAHRQVKVVLVSGRTLRGRLEGWKEGSITLAVGPGEQEIPRQEIAKATIEAEW